MLLQFKKSINSVNSPSHLTSKTCPSLKSVTNARKTSMMLRRFLNLKSIEFLPFPPTLPTTQLKQNIPITRSHQRARTPPPWGGVRASALVANRESFREVPFLPFLSFSSFLSSLLLMGRSFSSLDIARSESVLKSLPNYPQATYVSRTSAANRSILTTNSLPSIASFLKVRP